MKAASFVDLGHTVELDWLLQGNKVAGAGRAITFDFDHGMLDFLPCLHSAVQLELLVGIKEGAACSTGAAFLKERVGHYRLPFIDHESNMRATVGNRVLWEADTCDNLVGHENKSMDLHWDLEICLEVSVELMIQLLFLSSHEVGSHVIVIGLLPTICLLLVVQPDLVDRLNIVKNNLAIVILKQLFQGVGYHVSHLHH